MQDITNAHCFNSTRKLQQIVSNVSSDIIIVNQSLISVDDVNKFFSVYSDWSKTSGEKLDGLSTFCRALILNGKDISAELFDKKIILKGIGLVKNTYWEEIFREQEKHPLIVNVQGEKCPNIWILGALNGINALHEWSITNYLNKNNISTHRNVAILKLNEIVNEKGKKIKVTNRFMNKIPSIVTALNKNELKEFRQNFNPCIYASLHDSDSFLRINDASIRDIIKYISQKKISFENYFEGFVKTIAINLAKIHDLYLIHGAYTSLNIKLDGSFTDNEDFLGTSYLFSSNPSLIEEQNSFGLHERTKRIEKFSKFNKSIYLYLGLYYNDEMKQGLGTVQSLCDKLKISETKTSSMKKLFLDIYFDNRMNDIFYGYYDKSSAKKKIKEKYCIQ